MDIQANLVHPLNETIILGYMIYGLPLNDFGFRSHGIGLCSETSISMESHQFPNHTACLGAMKLLPRPKNEVTFLPQWRTGLVQ
jgi:hypothetical protein